MFVQKILSRRLRILACVLTTFRTKSTALLVSSILFTSFILLDGLWERCFEVPFSEFKWPPYADVKNQVVLNMKEAFLKFHHENDWSNFKPIITPNCSSTSEDRSNATLVLILIKSAFNNFENRHAIRTMWAKITKYSSYTFRYIFIIGVPPEDSSHLLINILKEDGFNKDILLGNYTDIYRNNTFKFFSAMQFAKKCCGSLETSNSLSYALFLDDDYFLWVPNLVEELERHKPNERLYMGWRFKNAKPHRSYFSKHRVSLKEYPFNLYPSYITGGAVLFSRQSIKEFYYGIQYVRFFSIDDVYAGIIAFFLGIKAVHNDKMIWEVYNIATENKSKFICAHEISPNDMKKEYYNIITNQKVSK